MIRVLPPEEIFKMTNKEFSVAWKEGTIHASVFESLGYAWEPEDENEEVVWTI